MKVMLVEYMIRNLEQQKESKPTARVCETNLLTNVSQWMASFLYFYFRFELSGFWADYCALLNMHFWEFISETRV